MEEGKKKGKRWTTITLFIFGLLMLGQALRETNPISVATALVVGGLLVVFMGRELWKN